MLRDYKRDTGGAVVQQVRWKTSLFRPPFW